MRLRAAGITTTETAIRAFRCGLWNPGRPAARFSPPASRARLWPRTTSSLSTWAAPPRKSVSSNKARAQTARAFEVARIYRFAKGSGLPLRIPVIEMVEIGAGGGSIASVDALGRIGVGPRSAGSEPGPVCYRRGGTEPTVTDADVAARPYRSGNVFRRQDGARYCRRQKRHRFPCRRET